MEQNNENYQFYKCYSFFDCDFVFASLIHISRLRVNTFIIDRNILTKYEKSEENPKNQTAIHIRQDVSYSILHVYT